MNFIVIVAYISVFSNGFDKCIATLTAMFKKADKSILLVAFKLFINLLCTRNVWKVKKICMKHNLLHAGIMRRNARFTNIFDQNILIARF